MRPKKTDIVRKRTGCQRCRSRRRQCDETRPECLACVQRGVPCGGYQSRIQFKDVSERTAEASRRVEAARWSALRLEDARRAREANGRQVQDHSAEASDAERLPVFDLTQEMDEYSPPAQRSRDANGGTPDFDHLLDLCLVAAGKGNDGIDVMGNTTCPESNQPTGAFPWPRAALEASSRGEVIPRAISEGPHRWLTEIPTDNQDAMTIWCAAPASPPLWEDMINFPPSRAATPQRQSAISTRRNSSSQSSMTEKALLALFQDQITKHIALQLPYDTLFSTSSGFRAAALALATVYREGHQHHPASDSECHYYDFAVADLAYQLRCLRRESGDALVGTVMLLIYRDLAVGSHLDVCKHLERLGTMSQAIDMTTYCTPSILKSWRMLSFDLRLRSLPTRKTIMGPPPPKMNTPWDSQITIRDIFTSLWNLHCRASMEAAFPEGCLEPRHSASRKAVQWLCSVFGRRCDRRQWEQKDYHDHSLSREAIIGQVCMFEERLGAWHRATERTNLPVPCLDACDGGMISGPAFGAILAYDMPDHSKAVDYSLYLVSRLVCMYLQSTYGSQSPSAFASEALAKIVLGIALKAGAPPLWNLSEHNLLTLAYQAAILTEGASVSNAIVDGLLPALSRGQPSSNVKIMISYLGRLLGVIIRERHAGRSVRFVIDSFDEDSTISADLSGGPRKLAIFGDLGGRGCFRDVVMVDAPS